MIKKIALPAQAMRPSPTAWAAIAQLIDEGLEPFEAYRAWLIAIFTYNGRRDPVVVAACAVARALSEEERTRRARCMKQLFAFEGGQL